MVRMLANIALTLALIAATGSPAFAQDIRRTASYHDLDLTQLAGVRALRRRVARVAAQLCEEAIARTSLLDAPYRRCQQRLKRQAEPQIVQAISAAQVDPSRLAAR